MDSQEGHCIMWSFTPDSRPVSSRNPAQLCGAVAILAFGLGLAAVCMSGSAAPPNGPSGKEPTVDGAALFAAWPQKGGQKPDAAIILSGQTFGLLQPCGCSRPQKGGLERRMQFINSLKAKGWPVAGVDLGDIYPDKTSMRDQGLLRYKTMMNGLREMGYIAVGVGKTEFSVELDRVLAEYALQKAQPPYLLAGNLLGVANGKPIPLKARFQPPGLNRPLIDLAEVAMVGQVSLGVAGIVGKSLAEEVEKAKYDTSVTFANNAAILEAAVNALAAKKTQLNVLIYQGTAQEAAAVAQAWPQFHVILCRADDPEPPATPTKANGGNTLIVQAGEKGRYVGVVGAFAKNGGGFELHYQIVPLEEFYITPGPEAAAQKANPILPLLESYAAEVRASGFLADAPKRPHAAQIAQPKLNLYYVGSDACKACHAAEHAVWAKSQHGHALDTLENVAKRPSLRNYDPECVVCHTVGFEYETGYVDSKKTPDLKHVGCENCHGPASGHVANPKAANLVALMSPWKRAGGGNLPAALIKKMAETPPVDRGKIRVEPADQLMVNIAAATCGKCHDPDNDPHFDFYTYWPKVNHTGMAPPGGWPATPPNNPAPNK